MEFKMRRQAFRPCVPADVPTSLTILSDLISIQISALVRYYLGGGCGARWCHKNSTGIRFKKVVFETFYG
jgi:hypothetical protein